MSRTIHALVLFAGLVIATAALFGAKAGDARAIEGSNSVVTCPSYAPYVHTNAFGQSFCSRYP